MTGRRVTLDEIAAEQMERNRQASAEADVRREAREKAEREAFEAAHGVTVDLQLPRSMAVYISREEVAIIRSIPGLRSLALKYDQELESDRELEAGDTDEEEIEE